MKTFQLLSLTQLILLSSISYACEKDQYPEFCFEISSSFNDSFQFTVHRYQNIYTIDSITISPLQGEFLDGELVGLSGGETEKYSSRLSAEDSKVLGILLEAAKNFPLDDDALGTDGSMWYLEFPNVPYLKVGYWSPELGTSERGLEGIVNLGNFLLEKSKEQD